MASFVQFFSINLNDPESGKSYSIAVTSDEIKRLETDLLFAKMKLTEAKDLEYAELMNETIETNVMFEESPEELTESVNEDSVFKWLHEAILLLVQEYQNSSFGSGKVSHKKLWEGISNRLHAHSYYVTGPQCQSKLSGMKKTYKNIKDHNNKSGNSPKHWPYLALMDDLMGDKPSISPLATCSSTGERKRTTSECSVESSTSVDSENAANQKKTKITAANQLLAALEERAILNEENKERRFQELMAFKAQKAEDALEHKKRALELLEKLVNK